MVDSVDHPVDVLMLCTPVLTSDVVVVVVVAVAVAVVVVVVVVAVGTNKDWGPENKLSELIWEFAWRSLRASMEFSAVLKKNFGVVLLLLF